MAWPAAGDGSLGKAFRSGTHRTRPPAETLLRYAAAAEPCGITRLANVTGLDSIGVPVFVAVRPLARSVVTSMGKGLDAASARASALMESLETWHAEHVDAPLRHGSAQALRRLGLPVVDPLSLPLAAGARPEQVRPDTWVEGYDLLRDRPVWVPLDAVSMDFVGLRPDAVPGLLRDSNGLASGNHLVEAAVHALCEIVERDATARWRAGPDLRRVDLATVTDPSCRYLLDKLTGAGVRAAVWDVTSHVGIPAYGCVLLQHPSAALWYNAGVHDGFGCHLSPAVAIARAVTEAVQTRMAYICGVREDIGRAELAAAADLDVMTRVWHELDEVPATVAFRTTDTSGADLRADLDAVLAALAAAGCEDAVVVDLSRQSLGVPVVKALVPGLAGAVP
ncbi:MAG TPA: YcaO-like family protein [Micromonosporaceae bacterium]|nr:YcaO-like family protein [Micromonosporaceae bacterium]